MSGWILWLGGIFNEETMLKHSAVSPAANRWQKGLVSALCAQGQTVIIQSHLPESIWPKGKLRPGMSTDFDPLFDSHIVNYWNFPFLRSYDLKRTYIGSFREICKKRGKPIAIISFNPDPHAVATGLYAQTQYMIPWIDLCADHYDPGDNWSLYTKGASEAKGHIFLSYYAFHDCVFSTKFHLDGGVSYLKFDPTILSKRSSPNKKIVLYTGMLSKWGGVSLLLKAFEKIKDPDIKLWICGHGKSADLTSALNRDSRIHFWGLVSESRLQEIYNEASILVNPRPSIVPGNKMNFPSKILEYLSYGKPVISTWTEGLAPEYDEVLEILKEETEDCMAMTIENVLCWPENKIKQKSIQIEEFLIKKRTWGIQANRLITWIKNEIL